MKTDDVITPFQATDRFDIDEFVTYLTDDVIFRFANIHAIEGKRNIFTFLKNFISSNRAIRNDKPEE